MLDRRILTGFHGACVVSAFLCFMGPAMADPPTKFQFGAEVYEVPFLPEATGDKMLDAGIEMYRGLTDAEKEQFEQLRTEKIIAHGWLLTLETLRRWTRPEVETTSQWWEQESIFGENGKFSAAKSPHPWIRAFIQDALKNENKNLWLNPRLALGQGKRGFSVAIGHVANMGAFKWGFFTGQMVGISCVPEPPNRLACSFFFAKEKMDQREPYNFSLEWGIMIRLQKVTTDGIARPKVQGVHMTSLGPGAFGSVTGSRMVGWTSTLSIYGLIFGYLAQAADEQSMRLFFASMGGWMWYVQNMALTHTITEQMNSPRFVLEKIGTAYHSLARKLSSGIDGMKNLCSRLTAPASVSIFDKKEF